jgi:nucleotide-binding universal stress UspA family protein
MTFGAIRRRSGPKMSFVTPGSDNTYWSSGAGKICCDNDRIAGREIRSLHAGEAIMFKKVVIPLDGSELAEQALAPACRIAEMFGSELLLLRVVTPERPLPARPYLSSRADSLLAANARPLVKEAEAYLSGLKLPVLGLSVSTRVLCGAPPDMIIAAAAESGADLIVMSTHGRAGLMRLLYGSVAEAVLRGATVPVLLIPSRVFERRLEQERDSLRLEPLHIHS